MSLRNLSNLANPSKGLPFARTPEFRQNVGQSVLGAGQPRLGGGQGTFGSSPMQANPQSQFLQQFLPMLLARRAQQTQQSQVPAAAPQFPQAPQAQAPAPMFMTPVERLAQMPQQSLPALTQAAPQPFFGTQPTAQPIQPTVSPGMQAQQTYQAANPPAPTPTTPRAPAGPRVPDIIRQLGGGYSMTSGMSNGRRVILGPNGQYFAEDEPGGGMSPIDLAKITSYDNVWR